jgi:hypothetical protein
VVAGRGGPGKVSIAERFPLASSCEWRFTAVWFGVIRVKTVFQGVTGSPYFNQMNFVPNSGTEDVAAANAAITATKNFWASWATLQTSSLTYTVNGTVDQIDVPSGDLVGQLAGTQLNGAGSGSTSQAPQVTQVLIRWMTGFYVNGRQLAGRTFIPGITLAGIGSNGLPGSGFTAVGASAATALLVTPSTTKFVIWHRPPKGATTGGVVGVAIAGSVSPKWAVLRSRRD